VSKLRVIWGDIAQVEDKNVWIRTRATKREVEAFYRSVLNGMEIEQKRIIKLLEEQAAVTGYVEIELGKLIALIKGENK
jgi:hypothetical protein